MVESNQIPEKRLGHEELIYLYSVLGLFACHQKVDESERSKLISMIFTMKLNQIKQCPPDNKERMGRLI
eukprot:CAMPEP_0116873930 /NCGR_PEP_ID=MMETSP0463-20121206/5269_1 /TAXON_ID=181622 /ORGANISM="Strombidinopsis sp, Strain SopsisLIS2011" /LENGTH=68 /DNA_ID=CAMNT_0004516821 /DNA_START=1790 /DNA_END=1996 /DNA_ORIENTATION=+